MAIPPEILEKIKADSFYEKCCITGHRPVQFHHPFIYAGKSIQEVWAIVPVTKDIHDQCTQHKSEYSREMDNQVKLIALNRATLKELGRYSKIVDLITMRHNNIFQVKPY